MFARCVLFACDMARARAAGRKCSLGYYALRFRMPGGCLLFFEALVIRIVPAFVRCLHIIQLRELHGS